MSRNIKIKNIIKKIPLTTTIMAVLLLVLSFVSLFVGVIDIDIPSLFKAENAIETQVFFLSRIPRLLAILLTGISMSVSGLIMQKLCMNKFVSPSTGATISGAQLGILVALIFFPSISLWGKTFFSFLFAMGVTWIFIFFIQKIKFKNSVMIPLVGIMLSNVVGGITNYLAYKNDLTQQISSYLVGSFSTIIRGNYELVYLVLPLVVISFVYANHFNIVGMGKDFSKNLGVNYNLVLFFGLTICSLITASIVSVVGSISYLGLLIPNIVAIYKGDRIRGTLIDTGLLGALFLLVCDLLARTIIMPYELPIELIVGIIGSILFVVLIIIKLNKPNALSRLARREGKCCG